MNEFKFEDKLIDLEDLLVRYRAKWQLSALAWMDYDDVSQIIRLHVYNKWHLWDQTRSFRPWASMVISHQIKNLVRNNYSNFAKPCLKCPFYLGSDQCSFTRSGVQNSDCDKFAKWQKKKERAYNLKLPLPIDDTIFMGHTDYEDHFDYKDSSGRLHAAIMAELNEKQQAIYRMLYIEGCSEEEVAKEFLFKPDEKKRKKPRYKQISNLKKKFYELAKDVIKTKDIM